MCGCMATAVVGCETCRRSDVREQLLLARTHERDFAFAVLPLFVAVGIRGRTEQHYAVRHLRMPFAECERDIPAHRVSDDERVSYAERFECRRESVGEIVHGVRFALDLRDSVSRNVERYDADALVEQRHELLPYEHVFEIAVQQHHRPFAFLRVAYVQCRIARHYEFFYHFPVFVLFEV